MSEPQETKELTEETLSEEDKRAYEILHQRLESLDEEGATEDDAIAISRYLTEHNNNKANPAYVVRGADIMCNCGTNSRQLNLSPCHGVYIRDHAVVHDHDCKQGEQENITWFGVCKSKEAPDTENIRLIGGDNQEHTGRKCVPYIVDIWQNSYDGTQIVQNDSCKTGNPEEAIVYNTLTMDSFLVCRHGGMIMPINSGQDRVVAETEFVEGKEAYNRVLQGTEECEEEIDREEGCEDLLHAMNSDEQKECGVSCHGSTFYVSPEERALSVIEDWQNDRGLSTHDVYESIEVLKETMTSEEIIEHISVRERLWIDMIEYGYSEIAAAGILGNIYVESEGYHVDVLQGSLTEPQRGWGMGLCQWSYPSRQQGLYDKAEEMGLSWDTYEVQVAFIFQEIEENNVYEKVRPEELNTAARVKDATDIFMSVYERPGKEHLDWREQEAERVYADYAGKP